MFRLFNRKSFKKNTENINVDSPSYFIVFQNKTYNEEKTGGYLWAPQENKSGMKFHHWTNMTKINKGDIIFSIFRRNIVSVNIAEGSSFDSKRPKTFDKLDLWEDIGWMAKVEYNELKYPININGNIDEILKLCPEKYSPFNKDGGGNQGYLFEVNGKLGDYILNLVEEKNDVSLTEKAK